MIEFHIVRDTMHNLYVSCREKNMWAGVTYSGIIVNSAIGLSLKIFPGSCILANLMKHSYHFFCSDIARNDDLAQLFVHIISLNICKPQGSNIS